MAYVEVWSNKTILWKHEPQGVVLQSITAIAIKLREFFSNRSKLKNTTTKKKEISRFTAVTWLKNSKFVNLCSLPLKSVNSPRHFHVSMKHRIKRSNMLPFSSMQGILPFCYVNDKCRVSDNCTNTSTHASLTRLSLKRISIKNCL